MDRCSEQFVGFRVVNEFSLEGHRTVAFSNSASPEIIWGLGGPEEDHQLHHCCWTGRVSEREEEEETGHLCLHLSLFTGLA